MILPPSEETLAAFGLSGDLVYLLGGEGRSWRCRSGVLKPGGCPEEAEWSGSTLAGLIQNGFRTPVPIRSQGGDYLHNGWVAFNWIEGSSPQQGHYQARLDSSRRFHEALKGVARPSFIGRRDNPWERADLATWRDDPGEPIPEIREALASWRRLRAPVSMESQVVHGDLAGNFLLHPDLPPAIIDFTPYWSPAGFGEAVFVVDAVLWEGADLGELLQICPECACLVPYAAERRLREGEEHLAAGRRDAAALEQADLYEELAEAFSMVQSQL